MANGEPNRGVEFLVVAVHKEDDGVFLKGWQVYPDVPQAGQTVR